MSKQSDTSSFDYEHNSDDPGKGLWVVVGIIILIMGAFIFLRTEPSNIRNADELAKTLTDGQPKVLEFYSNF
ncbi:MAG: hypothetical protein KDJ65_06330 [Anaerolineae bacterium]|nr:hypothetical protein [Anaerolineae bacterium]